MTAVMLIGWRLLPRREKYPLPPQQITQELARRVRGEADLSDEERALAALAMHFSYGAAAGVAYSQIESQIPLPASIKGILGGLALWVGSYLGWLPAMHILRPATRHPLRRNILMILAHIVWGVTLGVVYRKLNSSQG